MKIKFALLILVLILCSGCSVDYTLQIDERNVFYEKFQLVTENNEESKQLQEDPFPYKAFYDDPDSGDYPEKLDGVSYYATEILNNGRFYTKQFEFEFLDYQISRANSIHTCYEKVNVNENEIDGTFTLQTSSKFLCMDNFPSLNQVTIRVKSQKPIIVSNADDIVDDTYIWHINLDNYENHGIIFTLQKNAQSDISRDDEEKKETVPTIYVVAILGAFVLFLGGIFIYNFHLRNSK